MAVPNFLAGAFRYLAINPCTDVAQIIAALATELVALGWTDLSGVGTGPFRSPVVTIDASYFEAAFERTSATRLKITYTDFRGLVMSEAAAYNYLDIDAGGTIVHLHTAADLLVIDSARATYECSWACRLNIWPDTQGLDASNFACGRGPRNTSGNLSNQYISNFRVKQYLDSTYGTLNAWMPYSMYGTSDYLQAPNGMAVFCPYEFLDYGVYPSYISVLLGRVPHVVMVPSNLFAIGASVLVPIDNGIMGTFRVMGLSANTNRVVAVRRD